MSTTLSITSVQYKSNHTILPKNQKNTAPILIAKLSPPLSRVSFQFPTQSQPQSQPNKQDLPSLPPHYQYHGITYIVGTLEK